MKQAAILCATAWRMSPAGLSAASSSIEELKMTSIGDHRSDARKHIENVDDLISMTRSCFALSNQTDKCREAADFGRLAILFMQRALPNSAFFIISPLVVLYLLSPGIRLLILSSCRQYGQ